LTVLSRILDGVNVTTDEDHMWSTPFLDGDVIVLTISFPVVVYVAALRVWNYNCTADLTYCGVRSLYLDINYQLMSCVSFLLQNCRCNSRI
jgi:hypothetical protein